MDNRCYLKSRLSEVSAAPKMSDNEVALLLLKAIQEQKHPKLRAILIENLSTGPLGDLVTDCIERLTQLGLTVQEPEEAYLSTNNSFRAQNHRLQ